MGVNEKMTAIGDAIREKTGGTDLLTLDGMAAAIAGIQAGGGGSKCTHGTITPTANVFSIEHGLGEKPKAFIWLATFNNTMTGMTMGENNSLAPEQAYDGADANGTMSYIHRFVFFLIDGFFYSYSLQSSADWGYFTKGDAANLRRGGEMWVDETQFYCKAGGGVHGAVPYDLSGNITVHWFAIGN